MKANAFTLLVLLFLAACGGDPVPPIRPAAISPQVVKQLKDRFGDLSFAVDSIVYDARRNSYKVNLRYKILDTRLKYPFDLNKHVDRKRPKARYSGRVPIELFGEDIPKGKTYWQVVIEEPAN